MDNQIAKVLIVDDNRNNQIVLTRRMDRLGHQVSTAADGLEALAALEKNSFDLILLDIMMPNMDGFETLKHLKKNPAWQQIPVIVVSAADEIDSVVRCIELGAEDHISKPINRAIFEARVKAVLDKKYWQDLEREYTELIQEDRERAERILMNVLPEPIVLRLKKGETAIAEQHQNVAVLFADIVNFTEQAKHVAPQELINLLNDLFSSLDQITRKHHLDKIKTIGDAYMAVGGLFYHETDHIQGVAKLALEMQALCPNYTFPNGAPVQLRIGIHIGEVVAGIIGKQRYTYDLWGDTVNIASRMEASGEAGKIQVTQIVYDQLKNFFDFTPRGKMKIKGVGEIESYFLVGEK